MGIVSSLVWTWNSSWIVNYTIWTAIMVFLLYAFQWIISFVPYLLWLFSKFFFYPIEIIAQVIYPVWTIVYVLYTWLTFAFIFLFLFKMISKSY